MKVYLLQHRDNRDYYTELIETLGVFSSREKAEEVIREAKKRVTKSCHESITRGIRSPIFHFYEGTYPILDGAEVGFVITEFELDTPSLSEYAMEVPQCP